LETQAQKLTEALAQTNNILRIDQEAEATIDAQIMAEIETFLAREKH
jgi:hypothetical protein